MAAYYHTHPHHGTNTEIHQDHNSNNFHTLILMNPNLADSHHHHHHHQPPPPPQQQPQSHNMLLLNSAAATVASTLSPPPVQPFLGHPHQFAREPNNITLYGYPPQEARDIPRARQGLSLTLSSQHPSLAGGPHHDGGPGEGGLVLGSKYLKAAQELLEEVVHVSDDSPNYFKPNNNNNNNNNNNTDNSPKKGNKGVADSPSEEPAGGGGSGGGRGGGGSGGGAQLSTAERQEVQMKKAKLVTMLDEAEQRYRHYNHQMQIVIESFEQAAGMGSAKTYTALALKTISKQFRCLKDAIQAQIRAANKILGDDHEGGSGSSAGGKIEGSRLKYIDHQIRQQRALQQLGMIQNPNAWRPQRGLPERSVSVLRAWLFEHFLHPYPKDSDKIMLAKQTGLTRSQVSNWFINARVRLWKPMIEEMYMEEIKEQEQNNGLLSEEKLTASNKETSNNEDNNATTLNQINNQDKVTIAENHHQLIKTCKDQQHNAPPPPHPVVAAAAAAAENNNGSSFMSIPQTQHGFTLTSSLEMEGGISHRSPKRHRNDDVFHYNNGNNNNNSNNGEILIKFGNEKQGRDAANGNGNGNGYPIISGGMNFIGGGDGLGGYPIGEIGRFETEDFSAATPRFLHGNGISLSLGLPPSCENQQQHQQQQQLDNLSATNHSFISANNPNIQFRRTNEFGSINNNNNPSSAAAAFDCIDMQNRKGFAAQLLPDFVT